MTDTRRPTDPDRDDAEGEQPAEDAPTPLVEDGDTVSTPNHDDEADDGEGVT